MQLALKRLSPREAYDRIFRIRRAFQVPSFFPREVSKRQQMTDRHRSALFPTQFFPRKNGLRTRMYVISPHPDFPFPDADRDNRTRNTYNLSFVRLRLSFKSGTTSIRWSFGRGHRSKGFRLYFRAVRSGTDQVCMLWKE